MTTDTATAATSPECPSLPDGDGAALRGSTLRVIGILEEAKTDLAELKKTVAGELRVSAFPSVAASLIPPTIRAMSARFPDLVAIFEELEPDDSLAALRAWQTDVAIVDDLTTSAGLSETQVEMLHLLDDHLHVLLPRDHPLADAPATSTPPSASSEGLRYCCAVSVAIDGGTRSANAGTRAMLCAPDARTSVRHRQSLRSVCTKYPSSVLRTDVTVVWVCSGAEIAFA